MGGVHGQIKGGAKPVLAAKKMDMVLRAEDPDLVLFDWGSLPRSVRVAGLFVVSGQAGLKNRKPAY
jgi:hypothetical protein